MTLAAFLRTSSTAPSPLDWEGGARAAGALRGAVRRGRIEVRIVGEGTYLALWLAGRRTEVDAGMGNMPGGEFFACPARTSAEGTIAFSEFPAVGAGPRGAGHPAPLRRRPASSTRRRTARRTSCSQTLDTDEGAPAHRRTRHRLQSRHHPVHEATCTSTRRSAGRCTWPWASGSRTWAARTSRPIHWDIVKDLRGGGRIELDGRIVQENGVWVV